MKRLIPARSFFLAFAAIVATGVWTRADWTARRALCLGYAELVAAPQAEGKDKPATPAKQFKALQKEFSDAAYSFWQLTTDEERTQLVARVDKIPEKLLELGQNNPKDPVALEALIQVVTMEYWLNTYTSQPGWGKESRQARAIAVILRDHLESDKLGDACKRIHYCFRQECETFLRTVLEKSPHRDVRGQACLRLAQFLLNRLDRLDLLNDQPDLAGRYERLYGKDYLEALHRQDRAKVTKEAEILYEQAGEKYSDVKMMYGEIVGETAKTELFEIRHLIVGKQALEMEGLDQDGRQFNLSDYRGKVVLLYFWSEY
jgi:hypothetical protein